MKRKLPIIGAFGLVLAMGVGLAGCGDSGPTNATYDYDMSVDTRGVTISFWSGFGQNVNDAINPLIDQFEEATGITVEYTQVQGGYDGLQEQINLSASSRSFPNVTVGYPDHIAGYVTSNIVLQLDYFIEHDSESLVDHVDDKGTSDPSDDETFNDNLPAFDYDGFYSDYTLENESIEYDENGNGYVLGIPFNKSTEVMVYNKTFFENEWVIEQGLNLPTTWGELSTFTDRILSLFHDMGVYNHLLGSDGVVYDAATDMPDGVSTLLNFSAIGEGDFYPLSYDSQANFFITALRQWGAQYTEVDPSTGRGYIVFQEDANIDQAVEALTDLQEIYNKGGIAIPQNFQESSYCSNNYKANQSLMNIGSSAGVSNCVATTFESGCAPILYHDAADKYVISQGTNMIMLNKGSDAEKVASWKFIKWMTQVMNGTFAAQSGYFPVCESAFNSEDYQTLLSSTSLTGAELLQREAALVNANYYNNDDENWTKFVDPGFNGSSTIRANVDSVTAEVFIDGTSPEDVIQSHVEALRDYVRS